MVTLLALGSDVWDKPSRRCAFPAPHLPGIARAFYTERDLHH